MHFIVLCQVNRACLFAPLCNDGMGSEMLDKECTEQTFPHHIVNIRYIAVIYVAGDPIHKRCRSGYLNITVT